MSGDTVTPEDFGAIGDGVTDDTAALQAAEDAGPNPVRLTVGKTYLANGQLVLGRVNCKRWYSEGGRGGATLKLAYNGGACVLLGDPVNVIEDVTFENLELVQDGASTQTLYEVRGARGVHFLNCKFSNLYRGFDLGTATRSTYIFSLYDCEGNMRSGHSHFINVVNSFGQIDLRDTYIEGGFASGSCGIRIASNVATHVDHLILKGGYFGRFDRNISINARVTNMELGGCLHMEGHLTTGVEFGANTSFENVIICGVMFGAASVSTSNARHIYVGYTQTSQNCTGLSLLDLHFAIVKDQPAIEIVCPSGQRLDGLMISNINAPVCVDASDNNHAVVELFNVNSGYVINAFARCTNGAKRYAYAVRSQSSQAGMQVGGNILGVGMASGHAVRS